MPQKKITVTLTKTQVAHLKKAIEDVQYQFVLNAGRPNQYLSQVSSKIEQAERDLEEPSSERS